MKEDFPIFQVTDFCSLPCPFIWLGSLWVCLGHKIKAREVLTSFLQALVSYLSDNNKTFLAQQGDKGPATMLYTLMPSESQLHCYYLPAFFQHLITIARWGNGSSSGISQQTTADIRDQLTGLFAYLRNGASFSFPSSSFPSFLWPV